MLSAEDIERRDTEDRRKDQQCRLPSRWDVGLGIVDDNQALDDETNKPAIERDNTLPGDCGEPSCYSSAGWPG